MYFYNWKTLLLYISVTLGILSGKWSVYGQNYEDVPPGAVSLAIVFDITGSMYDDLVQVIEGAAKILATTLSRQEKPLYNYVLVPFHDPNVGPVLVTTDPDDFQAELRNLYVQGGGDCPEMSIRAIKEAIDVCLPNSFIYVFTDARSKDYDLTDEVLALIQKKQSQVVFVLTGDCDDPDHLGYRAYEQIASTSSGQVFLLKKTQVNEVLNFVRVAVQSRKVNLMSVDVPVPQANEFMIPIDSKLQEITLSVSGVSPSITLIDPSGNKVTQNNGLKKLLDIGNALIVNVKNPLPGQWKVIVDSDSKHTIRMTGLSTSDFVAGYSRKPVTNLKDTNHRPIAGVPTYMLINSTDLDPPAGFSRLELVDLEGTALAEYPVVRDPKHSSLYNVSAFIPPAQYFYVRVSGIDDKGYVIQRLSTTAITSVIPGKPNLWMPEVTKGYFGLTAVVTCLVESLVPYTVRWFKEDIQLGTEQYFLDSANVTMELPAANQYSEGIYFCNASNSAGSRRIPTFLDISEPPPSVTTPQNVSVLPGGHAMVTCNVFSTVDFNITWHRVGYRSRLRNSQKFHDFNNGSLLIRNVGREDEGMYTCKASNEGGSTGKDAFLRVQVAPTAEVIPQESNFVLGETKELLCTAKGHPVPTIQWLRGGVVMVASEKVQLVDHSLILVNMEKEDGGLYACVAKNSAGDHTAMASINFIESPHITLFDSRVLVASGDDAILFCTADGIPPPQIKWYLGDVELTALEYVEISDSGQLKILGAHELDTGQYRCEAVNEAGSDSALIDLEVGSEPEIARAPENIGVDIGRNATLICQADGLPEPKVSWQRRGGGLLDLGGRAQQLPSGNLFIREIEVSDEGLYVCVAQNQFGTKEASGYLTVTGLMQPLMGYMDPVIEAVLGEDVDLNCAVMQGNPTPKVMWLRDNKVIRPDTHIQRLGEGVIVIENIQPEHVGEYICLATNVAGNASFIVSVEVQVPPKFDPTAPDADKIDFDIDEGEGVVLPCDVEGEPRPVITWYKDESPISLTDYHYFIREDGSLEIYSVEAIDTGTYRCQASNVAGDIEKLLNLFIRVMPTITGDPSEEYIVVENETVVLPCEVNGVPHPDVSWRKNFVPFEPNSERYLFGDHGLTIMDANIDDKAIYECVASNVAGEETKVIVLVIRIPPVLTNDAETDFTVLAGDPVLLDCNSTGDPTPSVEWTRDESILSVFNPDNGLERLDGGSLQIQSARVDHSGDYVCIVTNDAGIITRDFSLVVRDPPSLPGNLTVYRDVIEDNPIVLRCPASGTPPPLITWYKNGTLITGDVLGVVFLEDGSLQITDTQAGDSASYKCVAENEAGSVEHDITLKVLVPPKLTGKDQGKPGVIDNPRVVLENNVTLTCPVEGDPTPVITWLRNGYELDQLDERIQISDDGKQITIATADLTDTARYTCKAKNVAGETEKRFDLEVHVPPAIDKDNVSPGNSTVVNGNRLFLDCPVTGIPRPQVVWYKDGEVIYPDLDDNLRLVAEGRRLEISGARVSDTGTYKCVGENVAGETEREFDVNVHVRPKVEKPGEINKPEVIKNGTVTLTCPASGVPLPEITWYKNNQPITANTSQYTLLQDSWVLEISPAQVADSARYTCRAKNDAGESEKLFDLHVLVPPRINRENIILNPTVIINQTTVINCPVEGIPSPRITWYKNSIQLDTTLQTRYEIMAGGRQLRVRNAQLSDTAIFQCEAINKAGSDSVEFKLEVLVPSRIDVHHANINPKVVVNGSMTIRCPATGVPAPTITWFKNGNAISTDLIDNVEISDDGKTLTIQEAQVDDTGRYTCRAKNPAGDSEMSYGVDVQVPPTIDPDNVNPTPHVIKTGSVVLNCPAEGVPEPEVIWLKEGQPIDYDSNPQYMLQSNGKRLSIEGATTADGGQYTCVAANEAGSIEQDYDLDVWVKPKIDGSSLDRDPTVIKGHQTVLYCPADGNPPPDILWLKNGEPVQLDTRVHIQTDGLQLTIDNATVTDTARYTCVARNPAGQDSIFFDLEVQVSPTIDESNVVYFRKVVENRTILIECPVSGIPTPEVTWLINGHPLLSSSPGLTFTHNNYHLEIASAQVSDSAAYTCVAKNSAGTLQKKFELEVQVPPRINTEHLTTNYEVTRNRTVFIDCPLTAIPHPSIMWLKDKVPLLDWPYPDLSLANRGQRLEVANAQVDDTGVYTCQATNPAGQVKQDFNLKVFVPPEIVGSETVVTVSVVKGSAVAFDCIVYGVPDPQLAWIKEEDVIEIVQFPQIRILKDGQKLQLVSAELSDVGRYTCHAENPAGIAERKYDLEVHVPPSIGGLRGVQKVWVVVNDALTLECPAEGIPPPRITWMRQGQIIQQYSSASVRILDQGRKLRLVNSQLVDLGDYSCYVENVAGNQTLEYEVLVYVPPTIDDGPSQVQAVVSTGATLLCESLGLPDPEVTWEKDGQPFPITGLRHKMRISGTIEFTSVRLEDAGNYKCMASNEAGNASREITLDVQVPPRMIGRQPLYLRIVEGADALLPCKVTGTPTPTITWQKGAKVITPSLDKQVLANGTLHLKRISIYDKGVYICMARNNAGTAFGHVRLRVQVPPKIKVRETDFIVNNAQNIVLPCQVTGRPRPKVTWKKDGVALSGSNAYLRILRTGLAIPFARPEDAGTYTCVATNNAGVNSVEMSLTVRVPPQIGEASRLLTFTVGTDADIQCAAIGIPPPQVEWLKDGRRIRTATGKYAITEFGTLLIRQLTEDDTGSYLCSATNVAGRATQERLIRIQVPPTFISVPQVQEVLLNSRLELRCTADGIPTPTIHWKRNDVPIPTQPSVNGRSVHIIHNVRTEDGGVYMCLAQNPAGEAVVNTVITVKVPPEILTPPGNKAVSIAERVMLTCSVGGDPRPEVIWMKNGRPVQLSERIKQLSNGSLVIFRSTSSDAGQYKCVATNDAGTSEGVAMLTVREPPSFLVEPRHTRVEQGYTVRIDCMGDGEPAPKMDWMIGWDVLEDKGRLSILPNNSLLIVAAQLSDSGTYRCLASNNLGQSFVEVNLTVIVHGQWSPWADWQQCSATCGQGRQLRHRTCDNPEPANQGRQCDGQPIQSQTCVERQCPVSGSWGNWLPWEPCSVSCDLGEQVRQRRCDSPRPQYGGEACGGDSVQTQPCNPGRCAVDGNWGSWSPWQPCSTVCGSGLQERTRQCDEPAPTNQGQHCIGSDTERQNCKLRECPVDGMWGGWGRWTPCSLSCDGGTRSRQRLCNSPGPRYGGLFCVGTGSQVDYCNNEPCPVHGGWSSWGDFGTCSVSCNGGLQRRFRTCSSPSPTNNGRPCRGTSDDTETCNRVPCPVDGLWTDWSDWSQCSVSCDVGSKQRERVCRQPRHGGVGCRGDSVQKMECTIQACYSIPIEAEGNIVGYINNIDLPAATFTADMIPLPDNSATHIDATLNNVPKLLAPHFRHLISVLSPVIWSTALEIDGAYNGYSLTKGDFTREVQVQFATGEILKMSHYSKGVDRDGKLQLDVVVRGNVPEIPGTQVIKVTPYWEQYMQTGPGSVHALSTRLLHVNGHMLPYAWNHSIVYNDHEHKMPYLVQRLYARNMDISINPEQEIVQYKLDASIAPGTPSNQCPRGFTLNQEGPYCEDEDECAKLKPCSDFCHNSPGSFACSCPIGFSLDVDGRQCIDIDECRTHSADCVGDQRCVNTIGSYRCEVKCRRGYRLSEDGQRCQDINECEEKPGVCSQICVNRRGGYRCRCMPGYRRASRGRCIDIDECELSSPPCAQVCANAPGSYLCSCRQGFKLVSGGQCRDINECKEGNIECRPDQDCVNSLGSYRCVTVCSKGSRLVGGKCADIDECATGQHRCYYNQRCVNTNPGYRCLCPKGYRSIGPGTPCLDIDECTATPDVCVYKCENTHGGFECICPPGQVRLADRKSCAGLEFLEPARVIDTNSIQTDERTDEQTGNYHTNSRYKRDVQCSPGWKLHKMLGICIDVDECQDDVGVCQHNCSNTIGSYKCSCPPGYKLGKDGTSCEDIDECVELNIQCGEEKMCFNTRGEFTCIDIPCPEDYQRDPITNYCVQECIDAEVACPPSGSTDVIEFRTLALPSGIHSHQDLIRLTAYNQYDHVLNKTVFHILENDRDVNFEIRLENGIGILFTPQPLEDKHLYKVKVRAKSYDNRKINIQYQTTFIIHIAVSAYPY